jgi:hypothetical protein
MGGDRLRRARALVGRTSCHGIDVRRSTWRKERESQGERGGNGVNHTYTNARRHGARKKDLAVVEELRLDLRAPPVLDDLAHLAVVVLGRDEDHLREREGEKWGSESQ